MRVLKVRTKLYLMSSLFGAFILITVLQTFEVFSSLQGTSLYLNTMARQRERLFDAKFHFVSYVQTNSTEQREELNRDLRIFSIIQKKMMGDVVSEEITEKDLEILADGHLQQININPLNNDRVVAHMRETEQNWQDFFFAVKEAVKHHEAVVSSLVSSNSKMVSAISANKILERRLNEVDNDDYVLYDSAVDKIRTQIIRSKIYLDGYTSVRSLDMIADFLLNINVALSRVKDLIEAIQFGSDKHDILPLAEDDTESLQLTINLHDVIKEYEITVRTAISERDSVLESIKRLDEAGRIVVEDIGEAAALLQHYSEGRISAKKWMDLLFLGIGIVAIFTLVVISRSITGPIDRIMHLLEEFSRGHVSKRLRLKRGDEIGKMSDAMDRFSDVLENRFVVSLQKISRGDLTFEFSSDDPDDVISLALKEASKNLNELMTVINETADNIATGSTEISDASTSLAAGASEQAASIEEITGSIEEVGSRADVNAEKAETASTISGLTREAANNGNERMVKMLHAMGDINEASTNIQKIIKVIDEIAFQTNLLALNAAVEAARAGKHGKGFAVVAEEVRSLAGRSAAAARQTAELIEGAVKKTEKGMQISNKAAEAFKEIDQGVTQVSDLVEEIATTAKGQAERIEEVRAGIGQIERVTHQNTRNSSESASISKDQAFQAMLLKKMLSRFKLRKKGIARPVKTGGYRKLSAMPVKIPGQRKSVH